MSPNLGRASCDHARTLSCDVAHLDPFRLLQTQRQVIAAQAELDRIAERGSTHHLDARAVTEAHLQQPTAHVGVAVDGDDAAAAADVDVAERAQSYPCRATGCS